MESLETPKTKVEERNSQNGVNTRLEMKEKESIKSEDRSREMI